MSPTGAPAAATDSLEVDHFDGQQARARRVRLTVQGTELHIQGDGLALYLPVRAVRWPERQRHGQRQAHLPDGGLLSAADGAAWDAWAARQGLQAGLLVRWMQSWRGVLAATLGLLLVLAGLWRWGVPAASQAVVSVLPPVVDAQIGASAYAQLQDKWLQPSALPPARQAALRARLAAALQQWPGPGGAPAHQLAFHASPPNALGANALALPGGQVVITDALVELLADREDVLVGVLGHELGHLQQRHGMRSVVQATLLAAVTGLVLGDVSSLLAAAPVVLGQAAYSRDAEFEADASAAALLRANGLQPQVMALLFERLRRGTGPQAGGALRPLLIGLASHPPDAERIRRMVDGP